MSVTFDGLISGIDTETIIAGLLRIQQTQVDRFTLRRAEVQEKQTAFRGIEARLLTLRADLGRLSRAQSNPLTRQLVSVSNEAAIAASAGTTAVSGVYQLTLESKARAHQIASQGFTAAEAEITQGTFELRVGSGDLSTINVDSTNNTLRGLADSINTSGTGVSASIVSDAAGGEQSWRLLLTATKTGIDNQISLTNVLAADSGTATRVEFDLDNPVQAAANARITIGSGPGAISVSSQTNRFDGVIQGVTFDLLQFAPGTEVSLSVTGDTEGATAAVEDFVKSFNDVLRYIDDQSRFNTETNEGGLLLGNRSASSVQQKLRTLVQSVVPGVNPGANRLSTLGITFTDNGRLQLNRSRLEGVLSGRVENVSAADVKRLFALDASSSHPGVTFILGSSRTQPSSSPYQVDISQAAEQAIINSTADLAESTVITSANRQLQLRVDGATATITLNEGTYTRQQIASHLQSTINGSTELPGRAVRIGIEGTRLRITSLSYGSSSELLAISGSALTDLGLTGGESAQGKDVVGNFIVDGKIEPATGRGRILSGNPENTSTADLQLRIALSPSQVVAGPEAEVNVTRGIAASLDNALAELLRPRDGLLAAADQGFNGQIDSIQRTIDRQTLIFERAQASLLKQFAALESAIGQLQATSNFVSAQLASLKN